MKQPEFRIVLASASPRRSELLSNARIPFVVAPANIDENILAGESPIEHATRLAREKARAIHARHPSEVVLGADTVVIVDQHILGKPVDAADAERMLRLLSGRSHRVITGVCLIGTKPQQFEDLRAETTEVFMGAISEEEISEYIETGEPMDKAGAYAIQGMASRWVTKIAGCYFNVVGLPVPLVARMLQQRKLI